MRHNICLDSETYKTKPTPEQARYLTSRLAIQQCRISIRKLASELGKGKTWSPSTFRYYAPKNKPYRHIDAFEQMSLVALDLDDGNLEEAAIHAICDEHCFEPAILHESFSSTLKVRKWRVIFALDRQITTVGEAYHCIGALAQLFDADAACIEPARLLYGTTHDKIRYVDAAAEIDASLLLAMPVQKQQAKKPGHIGTKHRGIITSRELAIVRLVAQDAREAIADPETIGSRYMALWSSARKLAQLALFDSETVTQLLLKELDKHKAIWGDWDKVPVEVIDNAIAWGGNRPREL